MHDSRLLLTLMSTIMAVAVGCADIATTPGGSGFLEANEAVVSAEVSGRVLSMAFDEGTRVSRGDTLLVIDTTGLSLRLAAAVAGLTALREELAASEIKVRQAEEIERHAKSERDRISRLFEAGTAAKRTLDEVEHQFRQAALATQMARAALNVLEARIESTSADIELIRKQLSDCHPAAPFAGRITQKYVEVGELLSPGRPIARVSRLDTLWIKVYLNAGDFARTKIGSPATVDTESGGAKYPGTVVWASDEAEFTPKNVQTKDARANLVYAVKVTVANSDQRLKIGMPVFVTVQTYELPDD
jgi:HlyD family secretion protein